MAEQTKQWAIYSERPDPRPGSVPISPAEGDVLLTDGCFTSVSNCFMREYGIVWHEPRLFSTNEAAEAWKKSNFSPLPCYVVRPYAGPTEPWERNKDAELRAAS